jgi:IS30 family transposase
VQQLSLNFPIFISTGTYEDRKKLAHWMNYKQLSYEQRIEIYAYIKAGLSQTNIAILIGTSKSTISREITRNTGLKGYRPK